MMTNRKIRALLTLSLLAAACHSQPGGRDAEPLSLQPDDPESIELAGELAVRYIDERQRRVEPEATPSALRRVIIDREGKAHARLGQTFRGVPVFGAEAVVHLNQDGTLWRVTNGYVHDVAVDTTPALAESRAVELAVERSGGDALLSASPEADMQILRREGLDHLVYRVQLRQLVPGEEPSMPVLFIDAHTGDVVDSYDNLQHVDLVSEDAATFDMNQGTNYGAASIADSSDSVANDAHVHAVNTLAYFSEVLGRDSFNGSGARVDSYVHYASNYVNAFWDGQRLTYGDGDGTTAGPLTTQDIVTHEFAHGVTTFTAGLIYQNESGALNEATSDIFAAATEAYMDGGVTGDTWLVGEDAWTPGTPGDALRYMNDPTTDGSSREHYSTRYTGSSDNGGVHWNSGIGNLFFYLLSEGGDHPNPVHRVNTVAGIGIQPAAQIWYIALRDEMSASTNFAGARVATQTACAGLYGADSAECDSVGDAWCEVGVGDCDLPGDDGGGDTDDGGGDTGDGGGDTGDDAGDGDSGGDGGGSDDGGGDTDDGGGVDSCEGSCGGQAPGGCYCDSLCEQYGDCCEDYGPVCDDASPPPPPPPPPPTACEGNCGGQSPEGCWCDDQCSSFGDCCDDYADVCG